MGPGDQRRAALERLDPTRLRPGRASGGTATLTGRPANGSRARRLREVPALADVRVDAGDSTPSARQRSRSRSGLAVTLGAWAAIGFAGLVRVPGSAASPLGASSPSGATPSSGSRQSSGFRAVLRRFTVAARWLTLLVLCAVFAPARRRRALVHVRRRSDARAEPDRLAPLPRRAARPIGDHAPPLLVLICLHQSCCG